MCFALKFNGGFLGYIRPQGTRGADIEITVNDGCDMLLHI